MEMLVRNFANIKGALASFCFALSLLAMPLAAEQRMESDTVENGGSLAADAVLNEVEDVQKVLMEDLHLAILAHEIESDSNAILSKEEIDVILHSFANPKIRISATHEVLTVVVPAEQRIDFSFLIEEDKDFDPEKDIRVTVDAVNHPEKMYIKYNIQAWNDLSICDQAVLVLHEHMGLLSIEKSLQYNLSRPIALRTSLCQEESE